MSTEKDEHDKDSVAYSDDPKGVVTFVLDSEELEDAPDKGSDAQSKPAAPPRK